MTEGMITADPLPAARRLIVALDFPAPETARGFAARLEGLPVVYKIGLELIYAGGLGLARDLVAKGRKVFLDAKLLDIPNTVERAAASASETGVSFLTVHGQDRKTLDAAMRGREGSGMKLLAITVLTSTDLADLREQGIAASPEEIVLRRAQLAADAGFDGVVASPREAAAIREALGARLLIVTPGIRPSGASAADQARISTPGDAIRAGADYLVVGRPITAAADPLAAAKAIADEIQGASVF
jgi:orotidine-5'-phosphate decarboxylase